MKYWALILIPFLLLSCDALEDNNTPEGAVRLFLKAFAANDYEGAKAYADDNTDEVLEAFEMFSNASDADAKDEDYIDRINCKLDAFDAGIDQERTATCWICCNNENADYELQTVMESGKWLVRMTKEQTTQASGYLGGPNDLDMMGNLNRMAGQAEQAAEEVVQDVEEGIDKMAEAGAETLEKLERETTRAVEQIEREMDRVLDIFSD